MNKNLELEFSELLLAAANNNHDRAGKILSRLSNDEKEKLAKALIKTLKVTLYCLPRGTTSHLEEEFGFELKPGKEEQVANLSAT